MTTVRPRPPIWTAFTDGEGKAWSWSRLGCSAFILAALVWGTYIVWTKYAIPDFTSVALLIGAIYGVNRAAEAWETKPPQPEQKPSPVSQTVNVDNSPPK